MNEKDVTSVDNYVSFNFFCNNIQWAADTRLNQWIYFLNEDYRGFGKTTFINKIALDLLSDGERVLTIGHGHVEYLCTRFIPIYNLQSPEIRGLGSDYVILVDEITQTQLKEIRELYPRNRIYGFGRCKK